MTYFQTKSMVLAVAQYPEGVGRMENKRFQFGDRREWPGEGAAIICVLRQKRVCFLNPDVIS